MVHQHVVVGVDESEEAVYAFEYALEHLYRKGENQLILVHVQQETDLDQSLAMLSPGDMMVPIHQIGQISKESKQLIESFKARAEYVHVHELTTKILFNTQGAGQTLSDFADSLEDSVLVVGSKPHGLLARVFIGSVGEHCVHHCQCPVYVIKAPNSPYQE